MTVLEIRNLSISFAGNPVLSGVNAALGARDKVGLVGPNGAGKTTLLRLVLGEITPDEGSVDWSLEPRIGYVPQKWEPDSHTPSSNFTEDEHVTPSDFTGNVRLTPLDFIGYDHADMLGQFGIGREMWDRPAASLSGGERTRLLLARAFSKDPELLVIDEPTNHLDIPGIEWLEKTLRGFAGAVLVVSHDRYFLDKAVTGIWEVREGRLTPYSGGYSAYQERLREQQANETREYAKWQRQVRELTKEVAERRQWYEKAHDDAGKSDFYRRMAKKHARQFQAKEHRLEKVMADKPDVRRADQSLKVSVDHAGHRTKTILRATGLSFAYGLSPDVKELADENTGQTTDRNAGKTANSHPVRPAITPAQPAVTLSRMGEAHNRSSTLLLNTLDVSLGPNNKVGLIGPNGSGKTTLIRLLLGDLTPTAGTVWLNPQVRIGYLSQMLDELDPNATTADNVRRNTGLLPAEVRNLLGKMGISGDTQLQPITTLSMGERTRVAVSCLCFGRYDALVLDEPTNHLDSNARECVEQALMSFPGALLVATHDRYFLDRVCNTVWSLEQGKVRTVEGGYSEFMRMRERTEDAIDAADMQAKELGLQADIAFIVSRISVEKNPSSKVELEKQYEAALAQLKELRSGRPTVHKVIRQDTRQDARQDVRQDRAKR